MTRAEARQKWCPFARVSSLNCETMGAVSVNRTDNGDIDEGCFCVAENCMAWRQSYDDDPTSGRCGLAHGI